MTFQCLADWLSYIFLGMATEIVQHFLIIKTQIIKAN